MSSPFADADTYTRIVGDSPDAHGYVAGIEPFEVELRPLDAGDRAKVRDALAMQREDGAAGAALGTIELLTVRQALVSWTAPAPQTSAAIERLKPDVLEAIRTLIAWGAVPPVPPTKAEQDAAAARRESVGDSEHAAGRLATLEHDELREDEAPGSVPLPSLHVVRDDAS